MHLFVIHTFSDLDTLAPIIYKLDSKTKGMIKILSVYPVQDFKKYELTKFLLKRKIKYYSLSSINLKNFFLVLFLKVLFFLPKFHPIEIVKPFIVIFISSILCSEKNFHIYLRVHHHRKKY